MQKKNLSPRPDPGDRSANAISRGNLELEAVLDQRIPLFVPWPRPFSMSFSPPERTRSSLPETHGKTTTTSMLAWIYEVASKKPNPRFAPSFLIGGIAENFRYQLFAFVKAKPFHPPRAMNTTTAFFDKSTQVSCTTFPDGLILTHVEFDHARHL